MHAMKDIENYGRRRVAAVSVDWNLRLYIVLIGAAIRTGLFGVS